MAKKTYLVEGSGNTPKVADKMLASKRKELSDVVSDVKALGAPSVMYVAVVTPTDSTPVSVSLKKRHFESNEGWTQLQSTLAHHLGELQSTLQVSYRVKETYTLSKSMQKAVGKAQKPPTAGFSDTADAYSTVGALAQLYGR